MKILQVVALLGILCSGISASFSQSPSVLAPFDLNITNLDFDFDGVHSFSARQLTNGSSFLVVRFDSSFEVTARAKLNELFRGGSLKHYYPARILDDGRLIAQGTIVGHSSQLKSNTIDGLILAFDSSTGAGHAAATIRKSIAVQHFEELIQRHKYRGGFAGLGDY